MWELLKKWKSENYTWELYNNENHDSVDDENYDDYVPDKTKNIFLEHEVDDTNKVFVEHVEKKILNSLNNISYKLDLKNYFLHEIFNNSLLWPPLQHPSGVLSEAEILPLCIYKPLYNLHA